MTLPTQEDIDTFLKFDQKIRDVVELIATELEKDRNPHVKRRNIIEIHPNVWQFQHSYASQRNESFFSREQFGLSVLLSDDPLATFLAEKQAAADQQAQREQGSKDAWEVIFESLMAEWSKLSGFTWEDLYLVEDFWKGSERVEAPPPTPESLARYEEATENFLQFTRDVILPARKASADSWGVEESRLTILPYEVLA